MVRSVNQPINHSISQTVNQFIYLYMHTYIRYIAAEKLSKHVVNNGNMRPIRVKKLRIWSSGARFFVEILDVGYEN